MIRAFLILLLSCLSLRAAAPMQYFPTTNEMIAFTITPSNNRLVALLGGFSTTNSIYGGLFEYETNSATAVDWFDVFKPASQNGRWKRQSILIGSSASGGALSSGVAYSGPPGASIIGSFQYNAAGAFKTLGQMTLGKEDAGDGTDAGYWAVSTRVNAGSSIERLRVTSTGLVSAGGSISATGGFRNGTMTALRFLKSNGTDFISADLFDTVNTWTDTQVFSQSLSSDPAIGTMVNGDSQKRFNIYMDGQLNWGSGSAITDTILYRQGIGVLGVFTNLAVKGLEGATFRVLKAGTDGVIAGVAAPAANGYFLGGDTDGTIAWRAGGGSSPTATSAEVIGSSTDYTFSSSGTLEEVDFGGGDPTLSLPDAGTYILYGTTESNAIIGSTITFSAQFKNTTDSAFVGVEVDANVGSMTLHHVVTVAGAKTMKLFARCSSTVGTPKMVSTKTLVGYIKLN